MWAKILQSLSLLLAVVAGSARAGDDVIDAADAFARAQRGELVILDVRTPTEWRQTGIPAGASVADLAAADFLTAALSAVGGDRARPIAVICRSGNRSTRARDLLLRNGFAQVFNIREGIAGNTEAPGWLARSLPVVSCPGC